MVSPSGGSGEGRVYFRDVKPYALVDSLDELRGPAGGVVSLSHSVLWAPGNGRIDLEEPGGTALAYQAVLAEGGVEDLVAVLDRSRLVTVWPDLMLPRRVRQLWASRFVELSPNTYVGLAGCCRPSRRPRICPTHSSAPASSSAAAPPSPATRHTPGPGQKTCESYR